MKLHNTLTKKVEQFRPLHGKTVHMYSCGPTVYDHIHIGNLSSFIFSDTLRRTLQAIGLQVKHVMNFTDVDDKTIGRSRERYPDLGPEEALQKLTREYEQIFLEDMRAIGNHVEALRFVHATEAIQNMQELIASLHQAGFAYIADDGVYFSIEKYVRSGKKYGQLTKINAKNTSAARINNDEYDKDNAHDFALWKTRKEGEPAWDFELDGHSLLGRPGWHIECSVMSTQILGQPFDIHTGGVDLIFPHHENEIAQSTALAPDPVFARFFVHNEHLLVERHKMSKSLNNFYTLDDIKRRGIDPLAFRLLILQSHYRSQANFSWENLEAAQTRLQLLRQFADLRWQIQPGGQPNSTSDAKHALLAALTDDLDTPVALASLHGLVARFADTLVFEANKPQYMDILAVMDSLLGLNLQSSPDITDDQKALIAEREKARRAADWAKSDELRDRLGEQGVGLRDTPHGQIWYRL